MLFICKLDRVFFTRILLNYQPVLFTLFASENCAPRNKIAQKRDRSGREAALRRSCASVNFNRKGHPGPLSEHKHKRGTVGGAFAYVVILETEPALVYHGAFDGLVILTSQNNGFVSVTSLSTKIWPANDKTD